MSKGGMERDRVSGKRLAIGRDRSGHHRGEIKGGKEVQMGGEGTDQMRYGGKEWRNLSFHLQSP